MNLIPLYDRIIVRRIDEEVNPDLKIVIPDRAKEKSMLAEIVAIGPGKDHSVFWKEDQVTVPTDTENWPENSPWPKFDGPALIPMKTKVGDVVLIGKYAGVEFEFDEEEYAILSETEVLAILPPKPEKKKK